MLKGKTVEEAKNLSATELAAPLGPLPPMKIHCGQMVEGALRSALEDDADRESATDDSAAPADSGSLASALAPKQKGKLVRVVKLDDAQ